MKKTTKLALLILFNLIILTGCATTRSNLSTNEINERLVKLAEKRRALPLNPKHGDIIWGGVKVGMTVEEVLKAVPNSYYDDQWADSGAIGAMGEAGVFAKNKVLVTAEIKGPYRGPSNFYGLFDEGGRLDGVVITTLKKGLPEEITKLYGTFGFNLAEFKEASKLIIKGAPVELGKRVGSPKLGKEQMDSFGSIVVAKGVGGNTALGVGIPTSSMSPTTVFQKYEREGYKSTLAIRTIYLGLYGVYAAPLVTVGIQTKNTDSDEIPDIE